MNALQLLRRNVALTTVLGFTVACVVGFGYFWAKAGGSIPGVTHVNAYRVAFETDDLKNLLDNGEVRVAGVTVGKVEEWSAASDATRVVLSLDESAAPLHEGATVRIGLKWLIGSSYVEVVDGDGPVIPNDSTLPAASVKEAVDVDELYSTLDPATRASLSAAVQSLDVATKGTGTDIDRVMTGLGQLGGEGRTVLDAVAAQSADLEALTREAATLLEALDTGRGQIATLVQDAQTLTGATAGKREAVEDTVRSLPALLSNAREGADKLHELSGPLTPIAADLRAAAPDLDRALRQLPAVTDDLNGLVPDLDQTLDRLPATLDRVPTLGTDVRSVVPELGSALRELNPMLAYLEPYGHDIGAMFGNFGATIETPGEDGTRLFRLTAIVGLPSLRGNPIPLDLRPLYWNNPYPAPGQAAKPRPYTGKYPRISQEAK